MVRMFVLPPSLKQNFNRFHCKFSLCVPPRPSPSAYLLAYIHAIKICFNPFLHVCSEKPVQHHNKLGERIPGCPVLRIVGAEEHPYNVPISCHLRYFFGRHPLLSDLWGKGYMPANVQRHKGNLFTRVQEFSQRSGINNINMHKN